MTDLVHPRDLVLSWMSHQRSLGGQRRGVDVVNRLTLSSWGHTVGFEGREVSGPASLGPILTLGSVDFRGHSHSVLARNEGETTSFLWPLELCGLAFLISVVPHVALGVPTDRRGQTDREPLYKVFSLSWLVWYILASASYKGGATAMAFGQVQGGMRGCPSPPPGTDTFKGSRATKTQHRCGKRIPPH